MSYISRTILNIEKLFGNVIDRYKSGINGNIV